MSRLSDIAEAAYSKAEAADAQDAKEEPKLDAPEPKDAPKEDEKATNPEGDESDDKADDTADDDKADDKPDEDDDFLEEEPDAPKPAEPLPPAAQYVYDKLPTLTIRGRQGTEGPVKEFKVKVPEELPEDFEYATARDQAIFNARFAQQDRTAADLFKQYEGEQAQREAAKLAQQEAVDVSNDMKQLQREGVLPKFKYAVNDRRFNDDPAVQEVQKVLDYYERKNREFAQAGRAYRIPFETAAREYYVINPKPVEKPEEKKPVKTKGDAERREVARKTAPTRGDSADTKPRPRPARSIEEILARHSKDFD